MLHRISLAWWLGANLLLAPQAMATATEAAVTATPAATASAVARPNFVLLLIDDGGFTDLGAYGGEARTPHINRLAERGALFANYHTSPLCSPSRAMLLTGMDNHRTGLGTIPETLPASQRGKPGYTMAFEPGVQTIATRLKGEGYRSYMTGKWHLGHGPGELPVAHGFDRSFVLDASGADNFEQKPYMPYYTSADWFEDDKPAKLPENFYSSEFLVDQMIRYLDADKARAEPFLAYIAFQAIHIPLQAPREFTANYQGVYDQGWQVLRERRWQQAKARGLISPDAPMAQQPESLRDWTALSAEEKVFYAKSMAVHAGMIEAMDHHVGRLIEYLKQQGQFENTVFIVTSDNGPEPSDPVAAPGFTTWMATHGYDQKLETLGERGSLVAIGPEWASATASPGHLFKFFAAEGGLRVPMIAAGPGIATGHKVMSAGFVTDIAPTVLDFAGIEPGSPHFAAMDGKSLKPVLTGSAPYTYDADTPVGIEVGGNAALFKGDYKLTRNTLPFGDAKWRLYHLTNDPGETRDLSQAEPERFAALQADYTRFAERMGVLPLPDDFDPFKQVTKNSLQVQLKHHIPHAAVLLVVLGGLWWWRRQRRAGSR